MEEEDGIAEAILGTRVTLPAEPVESDALPSSPKAIWRQVQSDPRWIVNGIYTETRHAEQFYKAKSDKHNVGDLKKPAWDEAHIWIEGVLAGDKTVAAFHLEYRLDESVKKPGWKFEWATYADIAVTPKTHSTSATQFKTWLGVFIPKETEKK